ncbi:MAG TPA: SHOCT domain-containing protein [Terriglobales bacterium]|nr:SHOCT domain-containing protein [Terriglobales bacterium]
MTRTISVLCLIAVNIACLSASAADTTYKESRRPSFTILVPDGWTIEKTDQGVLLSHGQTASVSIGVKPQPVDPSYYLKQAIPQLQRQTKDFRVVDQGACIFGHQQAAYFSYSGIGPNGRAYITKLVVMTNGTMTYLLGAQAVPASYKDEKADLQRIQDSFNPEAPEAKVDKPENLDALHAAGVITDQEYAARKQGASIFRDSRQPGSFTVLVPAGWTSLKTDTGVKLEKQPAGSGTAQVWIQPKPAAPAAVIASAGADFGKQWKDFRTLDQGEVRFAGQKGAYAMFVGVGGSGKPLIMKVVAATDGKATFTIFMLTDLEKYKGIEEDWNRIQQSFAIEGATP